MKNKLMMLTMALVAVSHVMNADLIQVNSLSNLLDATRIYNTIPYTAGNGVTYYSRQHRDALVASKTAEFFNLKKDAQYLLSLQPKSSTALSVVQPKSSALLVQSKLSKASKFVINPKMVVAGAVGTAVVGAGAYAYKQYRQPVEQTTVEKHVANLVTQDISNKENAIHNPTISRFESIKNAFKNTGVSTISSVKAHPYISTGAGLATVAGLSILAYKKGLFGKAANSVWFKKRN